MRKLLICLTASLTILLATSGCNRKEKEVESSSVVVTEAQYALADYYRASGGASDLSNTKVRLDLFNSKVAPVKKRLEAIPPTDQNYSKAQELIAKITTQGDELVGNADLQILKAKAAELQSGFIREGVYDAQVNVSGEGNRTLTIKSAGIDSKNAGTLASSEFLQRLKGWGFRKVIFTNGNGYATTYSL